MWSGMSGAARGAIKHFVQRSLRRRGLRLTHDRDDHWLPDVDLLDVLVAWRFAQRPPQVAVQIGANDGRAEDPLQPLIARYAMRAVLVEPLPEPYERLAAAYARNELVQTIQAAIDKTPGRRDLWRVDRAAGGPNAFSHIASFDRSVVEKHYRRFAASGGYMTRTSVRTMTVAELLSAGGIEGPIDILQVDTEGHDAVIVNEFLNAGLRPTLINYEHIHLSGREDAACRQHLHEAGYQLLRYGRDTAAVLPADGGLQAAPHSGQLASAAPEMS
jgi:FkbM family methyltransferase